MNKSMLFSAGLFSLICLPCFAITATANTVEPSTQLANPNPDAINSTTPPPAAPNAVNPTTPASATTPAPQTQVTPAASTPTLVSTPPAQPVTAAPAPVITLNCNYHIPAETSKLDTGLVMQWAQKAAQQTFDFNPATIDAQLTSLKACYTDQGWQSYNDALVKSGNLDAIKQQKLNVSSLLDGQSTITQIKDNQWKVSSPIQVVYQNEKEKIIQSLTINLIVSRKISGDLGIIQIVAIPRQAVNAVAPPKPAAAGITAPAGTPTTPATSPTSVTAPH